MIGILFRRGITYATLSIPVCLGGCLQKQWNGYQMKSTNSDLNTACRNIAMGIGCGGLLLVIAAVGAWIVTHGG